MNLIEDIQTSNLSDAGISNTSEGESPRDVVAKLLVVSVFELQLRYYVQF